MKKLLSPIAVAVMALGVSGCQCGQQGGGEVVTREAVTQNVREFVYPLPTAFETTEMLNRIEAPYIQGICNDLKNAEAYATEFKRALNMGVYSADMCYANTYNQHQTVMDCMDVVKKLIDALDITGGIDPNLPTKLENNENNKEELTHLISESFYDAYDYLNKNNRGPVSILIVAGSWIEALYITTHISENTFENKEMVKIIMAQRDPLNKLMDIFQTKFADNQSVMTVHQGLAPLQKVFSQVNEGGITESQIAMIKMNIEAIHDNITEPK